MASLQVNDIPDEVVAELERRAAANNSTVEAEHRQVLLENLRPRYPKERMLEALLAGPFRESDFVLERSRETGRKVEL